MLDSVPDLDMLAYLPQLLDGLMNLLSDPNREIRVAAHKCMMEFLVEIQAGQEQQLHTISRMVCTLAADVRLLTASARDYKLCPLPPDISHSQHHDYHQT